MLSASSPITFPPNSSPPAGNNRSRPQSPPKPTKARTAAGFVLDDDSEDEAEETPSAPPRGPSVEARQTSLKDVRGDGIQELHDSAYESQSAQESILVDEPSSQVSLEVQTEESSRYDLLFGSAKLQNSLDSLLATGHDSEKRAYRITTCTGKTLPVRQRKVKPALSYDQMVADRSRVKEGRARRAYYGIEVHRLVDDAKKEPEKREAKARQDADEAQPDVPLSSVEVPAANLKKPKRSLLWTEKYRARSFMDLVGDDATNRHVLRWLKRWDPLVFPHAAKPGAVVARRPGAAAKQQQQQQAEEEKPHRKILMLTGPPGLGKTTLAHVCARQAGYEVMEINASDDRSRDVVRNRIRTSLGTESVKTVEHKRPEPGKQQKVAKPVCVVVDEVDGVVSGAGGSGEGGFVKALIDLVLLDQKNSAEGGNQSSTGGRKKKGDDFRLMRPLILICNDVYHASLRPLRQSGLAEIIHVGKPSMDAVVARLKAVFEKEGIPCEKDAARKLCEAAWGMTSGIDAKKGAEGNAEGDLRGVMVVGEWVAGRLKAASAASLTRHWVEQHVMQDLAHGGGGARGLGRGGVKEIVTRLFQEGAGFPKQSMTATAADKKTRHEQPQTQLGFAEHHKKYAMSRLREMVDTSGDIERILTEVFLEYPNREFNDDSFLTKPDEAYEWLFFHDTCHSRLYASQEWELAPYMSQPVLACHHLFASPKRHVVTSAQGYGRWGAEAEDKQEPPLPFSGPRADFVAHEAEKQNRAMLQTIQAQLNPTLVRSFRSPEHIATDFLPYLVRLVSPDVKPVVVGGSKDGASMASVRRESEKDMVRRAAMVLDEVGIALQKGKIEPEGPVVGNRNAQWVYRMEPDLDALAVFESAGAAVLATQAPTRYAVRQVLDQELRKTVAARETASRQARFRAGNPLGQDDFVFEDKEKRGKKEGVKKLSSAAGVKRDFFGRIIPVEPRPPQEADGNGGDRKKRKLAPEEKERKVWVTFHEGLNNAVRKPITLEEFLRGF